MANYFGSIDLTKLGMIIKQHPELVKVANMKDGTQHKFLNIDINEKQNGADQYGNVAYLKASCRKSEQKQGINYFLSDLKESNFNANTQQQQPQQAAQQAPPFPTANNQNEADDFDLPF